MSSPTPKNTSRASRFGFRRLQKTEEEKALLHAELRDRNGRTSLIRYKKRVKEPVLLGIFYEALLVVVKVLKAHLNHHAFQLDSWFWTLELILIIGVFTNIRVPSIRRLHDVGVSGEWLWRPISAFRLLRKPSGPPNQWGDGPDLIAPPESSL